MQYKLAYDLANLSAVPGEESLLGDVDVGQNRVKFFVGKAIDIQLDASDSAFDTHTGGVLFESRPHIDCPIIFLDFCLCFQENCSSVCYTRLPFVCTVI
jgi:hypothetical protein